KGRGVPRAAKSVDPARSCRHNANFMKTMTTQPHGGVLVDRALPKEGRAEVLRRAASLPAFDLGERQAREVENIALGVYSPLEGLLKRADFDAVLKTSRLASGVPWTIPIVLDVSDADAARLGRGEILLRHDGRPLATMQVEEAYPLARDEYAQAVF